MSLPESDKKILQESVQAFFVVLVIFLDLYIVLNEEKIQTSKVLLADLISLGVIHLLAGAEIAKQLNAPHISQWFDDDDWE